MVFDNGTAGAAAQTLDPAKIEEANDALGANRILGVLLQVATASVRIRLDGTAPTTTVGHNLAADNSIALFGYENIKKMKFIGNTAVYQAHLGDSLLLPLE